MRSSGSGQNPCARFLRAHCTPRCAASCRRRSQFKATSPFLFSFSPAPASCITVNTLTSHSPPFRLYFTSPGTALPPHPPHTLSSDLLKQAPLVDAQHVFLVKGEAPAKSNTEQQQPAGSTTEQPASRHDVPDCARASNLNRQQRGAKESGRRRARSRRLQALVLHRQQRLADFLALALALLVSDQLQRPMTALLPKLIRVDAVRRDTLELRFHPNQARYRSNSAPTTCATHPSTSSVASTLSTSISAVSPHSRSLCSALSFCVHVRSLLKHEFCKTQLLDYVEREQRTWRPLWSDVSHR